MATLGLSDFYILKEILRTRSISAAVEQVGLSQPSISIRLSHLRKHFGDPLFVRTSDGMMPTPRMENLLPAIEHALELLEPKGGVSEFLPAESTRTFRISFSDVGRMVLLPQLLTLLENTAPKLKIEAIDLDERTPRLLESGEAALAVGFAAELQAGFYQQRLFREHYACIARKRHSRIKSRMSRQQFVEESYVAAVAPGTGYWRLDKELEDQGIQRDIKVRIPSFLGLAQIITSTDLLAIMPARLAETWAADGQIKALKIPVPTPSYDVKQYWHERYHRDAGVRWVRQVIFDAFANMPEAGKARNAKAR